MTDPVGRVRGKYTVEVGGKPVAPSVTGVLGAMFAKPALVWGGTKVCAHAAVYRKDEYADMSDEAAYHWLRKLHDGEWKAKAARGTLVHGFAADWVAGKDVECPPEAEPYLDALEKFYAERDPDWIEVERSVVYNVPGLEYGGSFDGVLSVNFTPTFRKKVVLDIKTGGRYPVETTCQLAAYRFAQAMGVYSPLGGLESTEPMPETQGGAVLYLRQDGTYELLEVPADRLAHDAFLSLRRAYGWLMEMRTWEKAHPERTREDAA